MTTDKTYDRISTKEAMRIVKTYKCNISPPTLISWIRKYKLGTKIGGKWFVDKSSLKKILESGSTKVKPTRQKLDFEEIASNMDRVKRQQKIK